MEQSPMIFAAGMNFKVRNENAPETVRGSIYFKAQEFIDFLEKNKDEKGWVHTKMMKSKEKGTIYFILDTWKPTPIPGTTEAPKAPGMTLDDIASSSEQAMQDIPF